MNHATRIVAATLAIVFAVGGMSHGLFEVMQGNTPTNGVFIEAIHPSIQTWEYGGEAAFTLIPNFLITGIAAITVAIGIIIWSVRYLHTKHGATVLLLLYITLLLVGGGIGQLPFFLLAWAGATRINKPLTWWRNVLPDGLRRALAPLWRVLILIGAVAIFIALFIAIFGYFPGVTVANDDQLLNIVFGLLGVGLLSYGVSFVSAFAHDIRSQHAAQYAHAIG